MPLQSNIFQLLPTESVLTNISLYTIDLCCLDVQEYCARQFFYHLEQKCSLSKPKISATFISVIFCCTCYSLFLLLFYLCDWSEKMYKLHKIL